MKLWQGLGYYTRARNLHHTAKHIYFDLDGQFPSDFQSLLQLKGVGQYTAAAIASICYDEAVPAIDGNVFRVFARYFNIDLDISQPKTKNYFFKLGLEIIDKKRPGDFNQAVMELGATVCTPTNPDCTNCPLNQSCEALAKGSVKNLPVKTKKTKVRDRHFQFLEISDGENFLIQKRNNKDVWKNLYNFPLLETSDEKEIKAFFTSNSLIATKSSGEIHLLSHQRLHITFWSVKTGANELKKLAKTLKVQLVSTEELEELPLPRPMEKYLQHRIS